MPEKVITMKDGFNMFGINTIRRDCASKVIFNYVCLPCNLINWFNGRTDHFWYLFVRQLPNATFELSMYISTKTHLNFYGI
jgi:hypothetical protein